jgi:hypothetical protein
MVEGIGKGFARLSEISISLPPTIVVVTFAHICLFEQMCVWRKLQK